MASKRVTVIGGSGFLGRQIVKSLAAEGMNIRVGVRHPERASFLERFGRGGQIELMHVDVWDESTVAQAVKQSASVINTVGHYVEKGGATFDAVHGQGALHVARQAGQAGAERLIHISGLGADPTSPSPYVRARGIGEVLVKKAFDGVTILRPSVIFGPDDSFFNTLAGITRQTPVLPLFGMGRTKLQPVYVGNVAEACVRVLANPSTAGKIYELGGPRVYTYKTLIQLLLKQLERRRFLAPVPFFVWDTLAALMAFLPNPPLTRDQVKLMKRDNVVEGKELTLQDLGIGPVPVEEILPTYIKPSQSSCVLTRIYQTPVVARTIVDPALVPGLDWGPPATQFKGGGIVSRRFSADVRRRGKEEFGYVHSNGKHAQSGDTEIPAWLSGRGKGNRPFHGRQ